MKMVFIVVSVTGTAASEAIPEMLELAQQHEVPVRDGGSEFTVFPLDSVDSAMQRFEFNNHPSAPRRF